MKIYNQDLTLELRQEQLDFSLGYLKKCEKTVHIPAQEEQQEIGHYEVLAEYENGGKDVEWVIDQEYIAGHDAYEKTEEYQVYVLFTEAHLHNKPIREQIKAFENALTESDFQILKYIEGELSEENFLRIKDSRRHCREQIRLLQRELLPGETEEEMEK